MNVFQRFDILCDDWCAETEAGIGEAAEPEAETSWSLVPKQKSKVRIQETVFLLRTLPEKIKDDVSLISTL